MFIVPCTVLNVFGVRHIVVVVSLSFIVYHGSFMLDLGKNCKDLVLIL